MSTISTYRIHVGIVGRKDDVKSAIYKDKQLAESDLQAISKARLQKSEVPLPWTQFAGDQIQGAWIEESYQHTGSVGSIPPTLDVSSIDSLLPTLLPQC